MILPKSMSSATTGDGARFSDKIMRGKKAA